MRLQIHCTEIPERCTKSTDEVQMKGLLLLIVSLALPLIGGADRKLSVQEQLRVASGCRMVILYLAIVSVGASLFSVVVSAQEVAALAVTRAASELRYQYQPVVRAVARRLHGRGGETGSSGLVA
jgi:hypothetical protein